MSSRTTTEHVLRYFVSMGSFYEIPVFCWVAPQGQAYPFITVTPVSSGQSDYTIGEPSTGTRLDYITFQVAAYSATAGGCWELEQKILLMGENAQKYDIADDFAILGSFKIGQRGPVPYQGPEVFENNWSVSVDYRITVNACAQPPGQGDDMSSSSSESSASSRSSVSSLSTTTQSSLST
jgi:hypothetical protein